MRNPYEASPELVVKPASPLMYALSNKEATSRLSPTSIMALKSRDEGLLTEGDGIFCSSTKNHQQESFCAILEDGTTCSRARRQSPEVVDLSNSPVFPTEGSMQVAGLDKSQEPISQLPGLLRASRERFFQTRSLGRRVITSAAAVVKATSTSLLPQTTITPSPVTSLRRPIKVSSNQIAYQLSDLVVYTQAVKLRALLRNLSSTQTAATQSNGKATTLKCRLNTLSAI
ncbi:unnamed protein product [Protopolystoma xenopodis]|uniref:Uncharacterized protein n=1 Tax=Protopolystoma xenopodis TaxID=117903 RepID=A0A3S5BMV3_9PLAT|nr:unnamed protein product [Protopolystoma xenopodis]